MQRFRRAALLGSALALVVFVAMLLRAPTDPRTNLLGNIHDAQARALFHGHWDLPAKALAIEAFDIHGKYQTYFGPWPTVLRMPILAITNRFDGSLTGPSMIAALFVLLASTAWLQWQLRSRLLWRTVIHDCEVRDSAIQDSDEGHDQERLSIVGLIAIAGFQFMVGAGSIVVFLASRPIIYHEMELWGVAGAVLTAACALSWINAPTVRRASVCCAAATITLLSRPSTGFGAVATLGLSALAFLATSRRAPNNSRAIAAAGAAGSARWRHSALLVIAAVIPVTLYAAVNIARFDAPFALPLDKQVFTALDHRRQVVLAANHNSLFGPTFVPTTVAQYLRPDALRFDTSFPYIRFPHHRAHVFGDAQFDTLDRASSIPSSMPGFTLLSIIGAVAFVKRRRHQPTAPFTQDPMFGTLPAILGGVLGSVSTLTIAYVAHRYIADFFPPLLILAAIGMHTLLSVRDARSIRKFAVGITAMCLAGTWISLSFAIVFQRDLVCGDPDYGRGTETPVCARR